MSRARDDSSDSEESIIQNLFKAASKGSADGIREGFSLLPSISKDLKDSRGWTPLMYASRNGHVDAVKELLKQGADPKAFNSSGQNSIEIATFWHQDSVVHALNNFLKVSGKPRLEFVNFFSSSIVDRQSYKRSNKEHMQLIMKSEKAKFVVFGELRLLVVRSEESDRGNEIMFFSWKELDRTLKFYDNFEFDIIFLGVGDINKGVLIRETIDTVLDTYVYFAINFKQIPSETKLPIKYRKGEFAGSSPRELTFLKAKESGLVAQARSVLAWHDKNLYCATCGSKTNMAESGYKRICSNRGCVTLTGAHNTSFPRTDPVVIVLVATPDNKKCLLGRQKRFPSGVYSCIAGFMEPGETIEDAARREVYEEAGIRVGKLQYHSSQPWPFPSSLMIGMLGVAITENIRVDRIELEDAKWFDKSEASRAVAEGYRSEGLKIPPPTAIAHQLIKTWVKMTSNL